MDSSDSKASDLRKKLLVRIRDYTLHGGSRASFSVSEPYIIQGEIEKAIEKPSPGQGIHSIKFALDVFGEASRNNINSCINYWSQDKLILLYDSGFYFIGVNGEYPANPHEINEEKMKIMIPNFRYTVAFLVILANAESSKLDPIKYLDLVIQKQQDNGAWLENPHESVSSIITVIYAIKLLFYRQSDPNIPEDKRKKCSEALEKGIQWLIRETNPNNEKSRNLWCNHATELPWQNLWTTTFVLFSLAPLSDPKIKMPIVDEKWKMCMCEILQIMIDTAFSYETQIGGNEKNRFWVETRIASSVFTILQSSVISDDNPLKELATLYVNLWRQKWYPYAEKLEDKDWDLSTALHFLDACYTRKELAEIAKTLN